MDLQGHKVLVTGGAGFIGSYIVRSLVTLGADVTVFDNISSGDLRNLDTVSNDVTLIEGDVLDSKTLNSAMNGIETVSHQAAQLEITRGFEEPIADLRQNTIGTLNVLNSAVNNRVTKLINASSACVYGQAEYSPQDEKHPTNPNWGYGVSKLAAEKYIDIYSRINDISAFNLRYSIVYGPGEWYGRVLTIFLKRIAQDLPPVIFGDGSQVRDFVFIEDLVQMHNLCVVEKNIKNESFNVSTGTGTSIEELAWISCALNDNVEKPIYEDIHPGERSRLVEQQRMRLPEELEWMVLDNRKAEHLLGYSPQTDLETGLSKEYKWLRKGNNIERWNKQSY